MHARPVKHSEEVEHFSFVTRSPEVALSHFSSIAGATEEMRQSAHTFADPELV